MNRPPLQCLPLLMAAVCAAGPAAAGDAGGRLVGFVEDARGTPVSGALISLFGMGLQEGGLVAFSDASGRFVVPALPAGSYTLRALGGRLRAEARQVTVLPNQESIFSVSLFAPEESAEEDEVAMLRAHGVVAPPSEAVLAPGEVLTLQSVAARVHVEEDLMDYAVSLARFTRESSKITLGASPRASLGLLRAAKSRALLEGRAFATPDDVRAMAVPVLAHRLVLVPELEGDPRARAQLVEEALARVGYRRTARG